MFNWLKRPFLPSHPFDPALASSSVRDVSFCLLEDRLIPACVEIYRANEAAYFPPGLCQFYAESLRRRSFLPLLAVRDGQIVGCCGIARHLDGNAEFCFGMVSPKHQRAGIGTAMLLVRLAVLGAGGNSGYATMYAVPNSVPYYQRFGFRFRRRVEVNGTRFGSLKFSRSLVEDCERVLAQRKIAYPDVGELIPREFSYRAAMTGCFSR